MGRHNLVRKRSVPLFAQYTDNQVYVFFFFVFFLPKQHFSRSFANDSFIQANCNHDYDFYGFLFKDNNGLELSTKWPSY